MPPAAVAFPGPALLGRGVVVRPDQAAPPGFPGAPRVRIDDEVLATPGHAAAVLHHHWVRRLPVVVELAVDHAELREPETDRRPLHEVGATFTFARERLQFLVWANTYDARSGTPVWWHGVLAERCGATTGTAADVRLPDGAEVWVDGGPRGPLELPTVHRESVALGRLTRARWDPPRDELAADQLAAVRHASGPARIVAPAGSGKTRVLTARLRHLVVDRGYETELVTAVAYNTRAAAEMRNRTADLPSTVEIRTIHSLAYAICRSEAQREVLTERDVRSILDGLLSVGRIPNQDPFQPYLEALGEARLALRDPAEIEAERDDVPGFADLFDDYRRTLERRGVLDFDEQIHHAIEVLLTRPDIRTRVQRSCTHLLVDEFQDLTPAFLLLLRLAAGPSMQVFGVGDDDQVIYSYAGATPDYLIGFDRLFPGAAHHALEVNYRCPAPVVEGAVALLSHNRRRVAKTIRSAEVPA